MNLNDDDTVDELPAPPRKEIPTGDCELLELAARALGARFEEVDGEGYGNLRFEDGSVVNAWNPLQFSGDAFDLAVELNMNIDISWRAGRRVSVMGEAVGRAEEPFGEDKRAIARRAVVRVAAEVGKSMG